MASSTRTKRLAREIPELRKKNPSYWVNINEEDLTKLEAYIIGPEDSCYAGKLVKIKVVVGTEYPFKPPACTFIQKKGGRIHPNLYNQARGHEGGKVCLSILGTWAGPGWAFSMTIDTVLITIQSLLDSAPLKHEPGKDDSKTYNDYVRYTTWRWLLLDYIDSETDVSGKHFLQNYLKEQGPRIWKQLQQDKKAMENTTSVTTIYGTPEVVNWSKLEDDVRSAIHKVGGRTGAEPVLSGPKIGIFRVGGSTSGFEGAKQVLSSGQLPCVSPSSATNTNATFKESAMNTASGKRKLDALDPNTARPDAAKKTTPPPPVSKSKSPRQKHDIVDISDDEIPGKSSNRSTSGEKNEKKPSTSAKHSEEVIVIDDD